MTVTSYVRPGSLPEALDVLDREVESLMVMAGGTTVMPRINEGVAFPRVVMSLRQAGLDGLGVEDDVLRIGATTTLTRLAGQDAIAMLADAARSTGSWTIRNLATVGGNLFTPSPGGDVAVALLALDATVTLASSRGGRTIPLAALSRDAPGDRLAGDELVVELRVPVPRGPTAFEKLGRKRSDSPAVVTVAAAVRLRDGLVSEARLALGAMGPHPVRATQAERALVGSRLDRATIAAAADAAAEGGEPATDAIATGWYRRRMARLVVARVLGRLAAAEVGGRR